MIPLALLGWSIVAAETGGYLVRCQRRMTYWHRAQRLAQQTGSPFVVIGAPNLGVTSGYGCGDICVDLRGCSSCGAPPRDLTQPGAIPVADGGAVVFSSCVLEYVDDVQAAWRETLRAAGSTKRIFTVTVQPWTLSTLLYPGGRWKIKSAPPDGPFHAQPLLENRYSVLQR